MTCQEKHDHLTTISRRAQRLCAGRKAAIKKNNDLIEETKLDLVAAEETKAQTLESLKDAKADYDQVLFFHRTLLFGTYELQHSQKVSVFCNVLIKVSDIKYRCTDKKRLRRLFIISSIFMDS